MATKEIDVRRVQPSETIVRVLVVDDHPVVRQGVGTLLRSDPNIAVVGEAKSGKGAIEAARRFRPDVILLDLRLPDMLASEARLTPGHVERDPVTGPVLPAVNTSSS